MNNDTLKQLLENEINVCEQLLIERMEQNQIILDGFVVDNNTFEDIRKATDEELSWFYIIRINKMRLRLLEE